MNKAAENRMLTLFPQIRRARDYHLYDQRGRRYLDLWLEGGRYLMGRRPRGVSLALKNSLDQGLSGLLPSIYAHRAEKLLQKLLPQHHHFILLRNPDRVEAFFAAQAAPLQVYRPFQEPAPASGPQVLVLPTSASPVCVVAWPVELAPTAVLTSDLIAPADLAALVQSLHSWERWLDEERWSAEQAWSALGAAFDSGWSRQGPWLLPPWRASLPTETDYDQLFKHFLERGFVVPPAANQPWLLPSSVSDGEIKLLTAALKEAPWNSWVSKQPS